MIECTKNRILEIDRYLAPFEKDLDLRTELFLSKRKNLLSECKKIKNFANGHKYFGFHRTRTGWVYRDWAPAADEMYLTGDFNNWDIESCPMTKLENGVFEVQLKGKNALKIGEKVQAIVINSGQILRRIPLYSTRVVQDP